MWGFYSCWECFDNLCGFGRGLFINRSLNFLELFLVRVGFSGKEKDGVVFCDLKVDGEDVGYYVVDVVVDDWLELFVVLVFLFKGKEVVGSGGKSVMLEVFY